MSGIRQCHGSPRYGLAAVCSAKLPFPTDTPADLLHPNLSGLFERLSAGSEWNNDQILREEIFSIERLEEHARSLAAAQGNSRQPGPRRALGARLRSNE